MRRNRRNRVRATEAFRRWARAGCPGADKIEAQGGKAQARIDLMACAVVFAMLADGTHGRKNEPEGAEIMAAVRAVYLADPDRDLHKSEITRRVVRFTFEHHVSERTVYYWLGKARAMWWKVRQAGPGESLQ